MQTPFTLLFRTDVNFPLCGFDIYIYISLIRGFFYDFFPPPLSLSLSLSLIQYLPHTLALSLFHCKIQEHRSITIVNAQMFPSFVANKYNKHLSCAIDIIHTCSSTCMVLNCSFVGLDRIAFSFSLATTVPST